MYILGISAFYHDSAACLLKDGEILAAAQEERFTRKKHDSSFPRNAVEYCLKEANIDAIDIENVVFYEKPFLKFERLLETYIAFAPKGLKSFSKFLPIWIKDKLFQKYQLGLELKHTLGEKVDWQQRLLFSEHHLSHAASAFYPSPYEKAAILTLDGVGEWATTSVALGNGNHIDIKKEIHFPHSLGLLYSTFTHYIGFKVNSGEYKVMGLAPYGNPIYAEKITSNLIKVAEDGSFQLDISYFGFATGLTMTNQKFEKLFGGPPRRPETKITQRDMDLAASIQKVTENVLIRIAKNVAKESEEKALCLAGGVALNCVANGILSRENIFEEIWVQPAAGDAGGALGAALAVWHQYYGKQRKVEPNKDAMKGSFLGPSFDDEYIIEELNSVGANFTKLNKDQLIEQVADSLANGQAVGWMQGRMEFGPRALGGRSIIADPRSPNMQKTLNLKIKYRESFRPFAPSILIEKLGDWFEYNGCSPYMLFVAKVKGDRLKEIDFDEQKLFGLERLNLSRSLIPAVTHVDCSARIQTVHEETNERYHALISRFDEKTGCPILVNTSFNVRGEPIVCTPKDAFKCFMGTELDILVVENFLLKKAEQNNHLANNYVKEYELD